jgi:hypothetical protein
MEKDLARRFALAGLLLLSACGGASVAAAPAEVPLPTGDDAAVPADAVRAGQYRLSLTLTCRSKLETAAGVLKLQPMSGSVGPSDGSLPGPSEAALLWGQTDLDLERFSSCLGRSAASSGEPIHPSVLVEVLQWDGERHQQVLLVSTASAKAPGRSSDAGIAMWVERVERGHIAGVWSRWELIGRGEGRWEAELISEP